jgi:hypothetical protein
MKAELAILALGLWKAVTGILVSKKVWLAGATAFAGYYCEQHGCDKQQLLVTLTGIAAILGQGFADWGKSNK